MKIYLTLFALLLIHSSAFAKVKIRVQFSPVANLIYQLDCMNSELFSCSQSAYQNLWKQNFLKSSDDEAFMKSWSHLMKRYSLTPEFEQSEKQKQQLISAQFDAVSLSTKIRIASFQSINIDDYFSRLDLVVTPKDKKEFEKIVRHFYPNFEKWWGTIALPKGKSFAEQTEALLIRPDIVKQIDKFAHFYEANFPDNYEVILNLFYHPDSQGVTYGQQIEGYSVTEFLSDEKPIKRIDVIIHELCHFFFQNSTDEKFATLQKVFEKNTKLEARSAYLLLNETLATTLGNGLINKLTMEKKRWKEYLSIEQSFYNDYYIDKAAKAILPWIEKWMNANKTLYDPAFVEKYVSILEKIFGKELTAPKLLLNQLVLVIDKKFDVEPINVHGEVYQSLKPSFLSISNGEWLDEKFLKSFQENENFSTLLFIHSLNIEQLKEKNILSASDYNQIRTSLKNKDQVLFSYKQGTSNVPNYVIVASSYEKALKLMKKLVGLKKQFVGVFPE